MSPKTAKTGPDAKTSKVEGVPKSGRKGFPRKKAAKKLGPKSGQIKRFRKSPTRRGLPKKFHPKTAAALTRIVEATNELDAGNFELHIISKALGFKVVQISGRKNSDGTISVIYPVREAVSRMDPMASNPDGRLSAENPFPNIDTNLRQEISDCLSPSDLVKEANVSRQTINNWRKSGRIFGIQKGNGFVYPDWQLDESGQPFEELAEVLRNIEKVSSRPSAQLASMITGLQFFDGASIKEQLRSGDLSSAVMQSRMIGGE